MERQQISISPEMIGETQVHAVKCPLFFPYFLFVIFDTRWKIKEYKKLKINIWKSKIGVCFVRRLLFLIRNTWRMKSDCKYLIDVQDKAIRMPNNRELTACLASASHWPGNHAARIEKSGCHSPVLWYTCRQSAGRIIGNRLPDTPSLASKQAIMLHE